MGAGERPVHSALLPAHALPATGAARVLPLMATKFWALHADHASPRPMSYAHELKARKDAKLAQKEAKANAKEQAREAKEHAKEAKRDTKRVHARAASGTPSLRVLPEEGALPGPSPALIRFLGEDIGGGVVDYATNAPSVALEAPQIYMDNHSDSVSPPSSPRGFRRAADGAPSFAPSCDGYLD